MTLYTYKHKFGKYPIYQVCAPNRNIANAMLTIWTDHLPDYDGRNCDFECEEKLINVIEKPIEGEIKIKKALEIEKKYLTTPTK